MRSLLCFITPLCFFMSGVICQAIPPDENDKMILAWDGREIPFISHQAIEMRSDAVLVEFLLAREPLSPKLKYEWLLRRGQARYYQRKFDLAYSDFQQCLQLKPGDQQASCELPRVAVRLPSHRQEGLELARHLISMKETAKWGFHAIGIEALDRKNLSDAERAFTEAIDRDPAWMEPRYSRAGCFYLLRKNEQCMHGMRLVMERPQSMIASMIEVTLLLAASLHKLDRTKEACSLLLRANQIDPDNKGVLSALWFFSVWEEEHARALSVVKQVSDLYSKDIVLLQALAVSLAESGDLDGALFAANRALKLDPGNRRSWGVAARIQAERGEYKTAMHYYIKTTYPRQGKINGIDKQNGVRCCFLLATCPDERYRDGEKALTFVNQLPTPKNLDSRRIFMLLRAVAYAETGDTKQAASLVSEAIEIKPCEPGMLNRYQKLQKLFERGKPYRYFPGEPEKHLFRISPTKIFANHLELFDKNGWGEERASESENGLGLNDSNDRQ